jgi:cytochrome c
MKKNIILLAAAFIPTTACQNTTNSDQTTTSETEQASADHTGTANNIEGSQTATGQELLSKYDCMSCHKEHDKLVGPAYADVAKKYNSDSTKINMLADKVIKGGAGNWGDVPMTPHPSIPLNDAKAIVKYILTVK